jgi:DNA-binding CsgD family transcriptional regulator
VTLQSQATSEIWQGRLAAADSYAAQAADVSAAAGGGTLTTGLSGLSIVAHRGHEIEARTQAASVMQTAADTGIGLAATIARMALIVLDLGVGQYGDALAHAQTVFDEDPVPFGNEVLPNMIEAAMRAGDLPAANSAMTRLAERAPAAGTAWGLGLHARSRALLAGDDGEAGYLEAIDLLATTRQLFESARSHLLYGEWLRRQKRRIDARNELSIAYDMFASMGAEAFAKRTQAELVATGERARKRNATTSNDLTPQETHVAELAAAGQTNAEIAAQLFLSPSTVEYHLRKVFRKLALTSRRQLKGALPTH